MTFDLHTAEPIPEAIQAEILDLLKSGDLFRYHASQGSAVTLLEQEFADMLGTRFALAVSSCSAALFLSLKALDLPKDARVLIPAFTFAAVPSSVVHANCVPVLVEVGANYRLDMDDFAAKLTDDISAVLVSHMRGQTSDMDVIERLCIEKNIPLIEDAAHSLGTTWNGKNIGTIGKVGCFSFQSYKLLNGGEGGILITDDEDVIARAVIMSGAYENNWQKHESKSNDFGKHQNQLPLYNTRLSNLSAMVVRAQLAEIPRRVADGLRNHDHLAEMLNTSPHFNVPAPLPGEKRAPDSIQFNLNGFDDDTANAFVAECKNIGLNVSIFGLHVENARAYWNWQFLNEIPDLPQTKAMLMRACDLRLPARLTVAEVQKIGEMLLQAVDNTSQKAA